ncbi:MAG: YhdP family protein, partial [Burkholderiales bacterium]
MAPAKLIRRVLLYLSVVAVLGLITLVAALRYWWLPELATRRDQVEAYLMQVTGERVAIGEISGGWRGLRPSVDLRRVRLIDSQGQTALNLNRVRADLSWWSMAVGQLRLHSLFIEQPVLNVRRAADGVIYVAGIALTQPNQEHGFADWVLKQRQIIISDGKLDWRDEKRNAPALLLEGVKLRIENRAERHRFGLTGTPPSWLAQPMDIRGDVRGASVSDTKAWRGTLFARVDYADIAAWKNWIPMPVEIQHGIGAARLWVSFTDNKAGRITTDVRLKGLSARLASHLPLLQVKQLRGRIAWQSTPGGYELRTEDIALNTAQGVSLPASDFSVRVDHGVGGRAAYHEIRTDRLRLEPLVTLANYVPVDGELVQALGELSPRGTLTETALQW